MSEITFNTLSAAITVLMVPILVLFIYRLSQLVKVLRRDLDAANQRLLILESKEKKGKK